MFALRRAAVRMIAQPTRNFSTQPRSFSRVTNISLQKPTFYRSFHQSWTRHADEEQKTPAQRAEASPAEAESASETVTTEPSPAEQASIKEESIATSEVADAAQSSSSEAPAASVTEKAQDIAFRATETVQAAASQATQAARNTFGGFENSTNPGRDSQPSRILYIGNLFFEVTASQMESEFGRFGEIVNSRIVVDSRGLSKGFGYVEFASQDSADRAVAALDQQVFHGRRMAVQYHVRREPRRNAAPANRNPKDPSKTLFIGNMSYQMSDRDLNDLFREVRDVLDVRVAIDRRTGQPRGFAHADFVDVAAASRAKEFLEKKVVYGRQLRIDYSSPSAPIRQPNA